MITSNALQVAAEFAAIDKLSFAGVVKAVQSTAEDLRDQWRTNATATAGVHGKHYPKSINYKMKPSLTAVIAEIEPTAGMAQAGMSFEYGSVNQPPHLDGQRALDQIGPDLPRRIERALRF